VARSGIPRSGDAALLILPYESLGLDTRTVRILSQQRRAVALCVGGCRPETRSSAAPKMCSQEKVQINGIRV